jgi:NhaC family Na+:H+ antiporter
VVFVVLMSMLKLPPFLAILGGALIGGAMAVILQPALVLQHAAVPDLPTWIGLLKGVWEALATGFVFTSGDPDLDTLLSRGGMDSMLNTIWLIMAALAFGSVMQHAGMLDRIVEPAARYARSTAGLVATVVASAVGMNIVAGDQYLAVVLPGRMFKALFASRGLPPQLLSRSLGDSGIVTAPLVPWNSCGAYMAATLGVGALEFLPFCFFNLACPLLSIAAALLVAKGASASPRPGDRRLS